MKIIDNNLTPQKGGKSSFSATSARSLGRSVRRSPLSRFIEQHRLTDALDWLESKGLRGENALLALNLAQDLTRRGVEL